MSPLVFAAIAPHGGIAVAEAQPPERRAVAPRTRAGLEELGRRLDAANDLGALRGFDKAIIAEAKPDGYWQMLMLHGVLGDRRRGELLSYEPPTYFGMPRAAYTPA